MTDEHAPPPVVSPAVLGVAILAGAVVAVVAAVASYVHMYRLMVDTGESGLLAFITPASTDGLVLAATALLWAQRKAGERVHKMAYLAAGLGVVASLAANIASTLPDVARHIVTHVLVAGWPPVALGIMGHLALQLIALALRGRAQADERAHEGARPQSVTFVNNVAAVASSGADARALAESPTEDARAHPPMDAPPSARPVTAPARALPRPRSAVASAGVESGDALPADLVELARAAARNTDGPISKRALNEAIRHKRGNGVSRKRLDDLHSLVTAPSGRDPVDNLPDEDSP